MAVSLIDIEALNVVQETKLNLKYHVVLDRNKLSFGNLVSVLRDVSQMGKPRLHALYALLLCVLLSLRERCRSVEDAQRLESLLQDLAVVADQAHGVTQQVHHLDVLERFQDCAGLPEVAQLVEGDVEAEQVREVVRDGAQGRRPQHVVGDAKVDQGL